MNEPLYDAIPGFLALVDAEGFVLAVNRRRTFLITGGQGAVMIGTQWLRLWADASREDAKAALVTALKGVTAGFVCSNERTGAGSDDWDVLVSPIIDDACAVERLLICAYEREVRPALVDALVSAGARRRWNGEHGVQNTDERFALLLNSSGEGIYGMTSDGLCSFLNPAGAAMLGYEPAELVGRNLHALIHHHHADGRAYLHEDCKLNASAKCGEPVRIDDEVFWRKDGSAVPVSYSVHPVMVGGRHDGAVITFSDISERKLAEHALLASQQRMRLATDVAELGIWTWDITNDIVAWENDRVFEIFGVPEGNALVNLDRLLHQVVHPHDVALVEAAVSRLINGAGRVQVVCRIHRLDNGEQRWIELNGQIQETSTLNAPHALGTVADVTDRKLQEESLRQLAADLSEADRRKTEFLATLSHELRNPLAPLRNGLQLIRLAADNPATIARVRSMMERQVEHIVHLVDDLLDVARISSGKIELKKESLELRKIIANAVESSGPLIEAGRHEFTVEVGEAPLLLFADPTRLAQVLSNLLNNAAKYTPAGGKISLRALRDGHDAYIEIIDSGIGIPSNMLSAIFEIFSQIEAHANQAQGGLGIGLALVRRLVELHGGTVSATSPGVGLGSVFTIRLPLAHGGEDSTAAESLLALQVSALPQQRTRILVVDDNVDSAESLAAFLAHYGHDVRTAHDGLQAVRVAPKFIPNIIFLDIGLPQMNGYEVASQLRAYPDLKHTLLVALTGWGTEADRERSAAAGFAHHLTKPVDPAVVSALVHAFPRPFS